MNTRRSCIFAVQIRKPGLGTDGLKGIWFPSNCIDSSYPGPRIVLQGATVRARYCTVCKYQVQCSIVWFDFRSGLDLSLKLGGLFGNLFLQGAGLVSWKACMIQVSIREYNQPTSHDRI